LGLGEAAKTFVACAPRRDTPSRALPAPPRTSLPIRGTRKRFISWEFLPLSLIWVFRPGGRLTAGCQAVVGSWSGLCKQPGRFPYRAVGITRRSLPAGWDAPRLGRPTPTWGQPALGWRPRPLAGSSEPG